MTRPTDSETDEDTLPSLIEDSSEEEDDEAYQAAARLKETQLRHRQEENAKELREKEKEVQARREEEKAAIQRIRKERKLQMQRLREEKDLAQLMTKHVDSCKSGLDQYISGDYASAAASFQMMQSATAKLGDRAPEFNPANPKEDSTLQYLLIRSIFESDLQGVRGDHILEELGRLAEKYPTAPVFWMLGRALNRYRPRSRETEKVLCRAMELCTARDLGRIYLTSDCLLAESDVNTLSDLINHELDIVRNRPKPDDTCGYDKCCKKEIYWGDGNDETIYARVGCTAGHDELYHKSCWRKVAHGKNGKDIVGQPCPANDCEICAGVVSLYEAVTGHGTVRKSWRQEPVPSAPTPAQVTAASEAADDEVRVEEEPHAEETNDDDHRAGEVGKDEQEHDQISLDEAQRSLSAFTLDLSKATVLLPRAMAPHESHSNINKNKNKSKNRTRNKNGAMSLGEFWKVEEEKEAIREEELRALRKEVPLVDLKETLKVLKRRPTKKLARSKISETTAVDL